MGAKTFTDVNNNADWVNAKLAELSSFSWLFEWGMYIFLFLTMAILFWIFFDSIIKRKDQKALVPRILSMIGFFAIIPSFIFRFTGTADGITHVVRLNADDMITYYPGPINYNVNWLLGGYGPLIAIIALAGVVISIMAVVIYASTVHRAKPATEFTNAIDRRIGGLEARMAAQPAQQNPSSMGMNMQSQNISGGSATIIDRPQSSATVIDVPKSGATLTVESGPDSGRWYELPAKNVVVGRDGSCDISLSDQKVSGSHFQLWYGGPSGWSIIDSNSTNGTHVNDVRIIGQTAISNGSKIRVGDTVLIFRQN